MLHTRDYSFNKDQFLGKPAKGSLSGAGGLKGKKLQRAISSGAAFRKRRALAKKTPVAPKVQPPTKNQKSRMKANARILNEPAPHLRDLKAHIGGHNKNLAPGALAQARRNAMMNVGASRPLPPSKGPVRQGTKQDAADFLAAQSRFKKNQSDYHTELHGELDRVHSKKKAPTTRVVKKDPHAGHDHDH